MSFHIRDNIFIERRDGGKVWLYDKDVDISFEFSADEWCSMVDAVSAYPCQAETHQAVCFFHNGTARQKIKESAPTSTNT